MSMQRVDDLSMPPVVGSHYLVQCLLVQQAGRAHWWPIMGPRHSDPDLGVPTAHYHYDPRFMTDKEIGNRLRGLFWPDLMIDPAIFGAILTWPGGSDPVYQRRRCRREMPAHFADAEAWRASPPKWLPDLENRFADVSLRDCRTCPHRGLSLAQLPAEGSVVTCRGHGLRWDLTTGRLVRRDRFGAGARPR